MNKENNGSIVSAIIFVVILVWAWDWDVSWYWKADLAYILASLYQGVYNIVKPAMIRNLDQKCSGRDCCGPFLSMHNMHRATMTERIRIIKFHTVKCGKRMRFCSST